MHLVKAFPGAMEQERSSPESETSAVRPHLEPDESKQNVHNLFSPLYSVHIVHQLAQSNEELITLFVLPQCCCLLQSVKKLKMHIFPISIYMRAHTHIYQKVTPSKHSHGR
jgi:hypothetical protein